MVLMCVDVWVWARKEEKWLELHISYYIMFFFFGPPNLSSFCSILVYPFIRSKIKSPDLQCTHNMDFDKNFTFFVIRSFEIFPVPIFLTFWYHHSGSDNPIQRNTPFRETFFCPINIKGQNKQHHSHRSTAFFSFSPSFSPSLYFKSWGWVVLCCCLQQELLMPLVSNTGGISLILLPTRMVFLNVESLVWTIHGRKFALLCSKRSKG